MRFGVARGLHRPDRQRKALSFLVRRTGSCCLWLSLSRIGSIHPAHTLLALPGVNSWTTSPSILPTRHYHRAPVHSFSMGRSFASQGDNDKAPSEEEEKDADTVASAPKATKRQRASAKTASTQAKKTKSASPTKKKRTKAADHQRITERDPLPRLWNPEQVNDGSYAFKIVSWNVAGLRALLRKNPQALSEIVTNHKIDVLCLQEHKLQEMHLDDPKLKIGGHLLEAEGYDAYYSCSTAKKGYSGTAVFVKRRNDDNEMARLVPTNVSYGMGKEQHDAEGRMISLDFPDFSMTNVYVPNSGQKLERLDYRTKQWDKDFLDFQQETQKRRGAPVMWLGDLNIAHMAPDVWNDGAKHLDTQAGVTPQERASFQEQLDSGFVDAFRKLHPTKQGQYSYWSMRAGNRLPNKGLRLDYFVCDSSLFDDDSKVVVRDTYILHDQEGSDHCPVVLELEIKR